VRVTAARVQIPASPPEKSESDFRVRTFDSPFSPDALQTDVCRAFYFRGYFDA